MRRISFDTFTFAFQVVYLGLMTNLLLLLAASPLVLLLLMTDPATSWPAIAVAAVFAAPGLAAACGVFRQYTQGNGEVARAFIASYRRTWRKALIIGLVAVSGLAVLLVDVRLAGASEIGAMFVPVLLVLAVLVAMTALISLIALAEEPAARLRDIARAALVLGVRRWYLSAVSALVLLGQAWVFTSMPVIGMGVTASAALYLVWANSRFTLRPVLDLEEAVA
ncbi:DUF624 domain-containing protein [Populibacterium corticicola]|uniref:DUF624 domain-containing protein n=1 Tax=Populibacterium corticicola TaxID=1812826 RepID=A0ABW5XE20_9MICO